MRHLSTDNALEAPRGAKCFTCSELHRNRTISFFLVTRISISANASENDRYELLEAKKRKKNIKQEIDELKFNNNVNLILDK